MKLSGHKKGATEDIARKLHDAPLQAWRLGLTNLKGADADFSDRLFYANGLADKAFTSGVGAWRPRSHLTATKTIEHTPALSDAARDDCRDVLRGGRDRRVRDRGGGVDCAALRAARVGPLAALREM
jgi:hypothetical protein